MLGLGERSGVLSSCHEFQKARCTSILVFATLESSWSGAIWAFGIMFPLDVKFGRQVCRRINGQEIYIDTPLPRRRACPDVIQTPYILPPSCVVTGLLLPRFSAPLCKRPTSRSGISFGHTSQRDFHSSRASTCPSIVASALKL
jgi:hypothetical protein